MIKAVTTAATALAIVLGSVSLGAAQDAGAEKKPSRAEMLDKRFDRMDQNKDGFVERADLERPATRIFDRADKNKDGVVDAEEIKAISGKRAGQLQKRFTRADADGDGRVTKEEMLAKLPPWFDRADTDKDGKVSKAEMTAFAEKLKKGKDKEDMN